MPDLSDVMSLPCSLGPDASVSAALCEVGWSGARVLIVTDPDGRPIGVLGERALLRGRQRGAKRVGDIMAPVTVRLAVTDPVEDAGRRLLATGSEAAVVLDEGFCVGVLSVSDVLAHIAEDIAFSDARVGHHLDRSIPYAGPDEPLHVAAERFGPRIRHLPVVDRAFRVVGLLTASTVRALAGRRVGPDATTGWTPAQQASARLTSGPPAGLAASAESPERGVPGPAAEPALSAEASPRVELGAAEPPSPGAHASLRFPIRHSALATACRELGQLSVLDVMEHRPTTIHEDALLSEAAPQLLRGGAEALVVVDGDDKLLGLLKNADLLAEACRLAGGPDVSPTAGPSKESGASPARPVGERVDGDGDGSGQPWPGGGRPGAPANDQGRRKVG